MAPTNNDSDSHGFPARMRKQLQRLPSLDLLGAFEAVARHLSFTKAGAERFVTQSAISRQVKTLEEDLGVRLFHRKHRALELTDEGRYLYETCASMLRQLRLTLARINAPERAMLSLTTTPGLASLWLIPRLPLFTRAHPEIDVRIDATFARRDLRADGLDLAIRYGRVDAPQGTALFREAMLPVCSPALARDKTLPLATPSDLRLHTLLEVPVPPGSSMPLEWDPWLQAVGLPDLRPAATLGFSNYDGAIAAALAGQGVALGRLPLVDDLLKTRKLVAPFRGPVASPRAYFLIVEPEARSRPAVQAFEHWLLQQTRDEGSKAVGRAGPKD